MKNLKITLAAFSLCAMLASCTIVTNDGARYYCNGNFTVVSSNRDGTSVIRLNNGSLQIVATNKLRSYQEQTSVGNTMFGCRRY